MALKDDRVSPESANIWHHEHDAPYARRSVSSIFISVALIALLIAFAYWFFVGRNAPQDLSYSNAQNQSAQASTALPQTANTRASYSAPPTQSAATETKSGGGPVGFFKRLIGGITNTVGDGPGIRAVDPTVELQQEYSRLENIDDGYRHSFNDVLDSQITGSQGEEAGELHDVIIHKDTGVAKAIIIDKEGQYYDTDLTAIKFKNIIKQEANGDVLMSMDRQDVLNNRDFNYAALNDEDYVSIRHLKDGQVLDYEGNVAGQIDAVIYENGEAQNIYFALSPSLSPQGVSHVFGLPYTAVQVVKNLDGYDIKLSKEQTESLAEALY